MLLMLLISNNVDLATVGLPTFRFLPMGLLLQYISPEHQIPYQIVSKHICPDFLPTLRAHVSDTKFTSTALQSTFYML